jgi:ribosomal protein S12 methylthiotransferase accessory factor
MVDDGLELLVSPDVGVIHRVDEGVAGFDHPRLAAHTSTACDTAPLFGVHHDGNSGGMGTDVHSSRAAAIGEALERYSACHAPLSRLHRMRRSELSDDRPAVPPDWLAPGTGDPVVHWVSGHRLRSDSNLLIHAQAAWLPASRVYLSGIDLQAGLEIVTSTGLAHHPNPWQALRSGLLEVIERDAFMVSWLTRSGATPLATSLRWRDALGVEVRFDLAVEAYRLYLLDTPTRVPVVLALAIGAQNQPPIAVGAAAHLDLAAACRKALLEARQTFAWTVYMRAVRRPVPDRDGLADLADHVAYYLDAGRLGAFDHLLSMPEDHGHSVDLTPVPTIDDARADVARILSRADAANLDCYCADVTSPDIRESGGWVVRAILPALYPLTVGPGHRAGHRRLNDHPAPNPDPHPFP